MKKILPFVLCLILFSCTKDEPADIPEATMFHNVEDFGAFGNDNLDDSEAILAALAEARSGEVKKVFLPEGTYLISKTLYVPSGVEFYGDGMEKSTIKNHPAAAKGLDIITPIDGIISNPEIWSYKTMIATEGADFNIGTLVENVKIHSLGVDWNQVGGGENSILPIMISRANSSKVYNLRLHDALDGDLKGTKDKKQGLGILFAFCNDCELFDSFIGSADYESVSVRYLSKRTKIYNNTIRVNKSESFGAQTHLIQVARPSVAVERMQELFGETLCKDTFIEKNILILEKGSGHAVTSHNSDGFYVRNNSIRFLSTLSAAWGIKPFSNTTNIEISGNTIDVTEFRNLQKGCTLISTGTSLGSEGISNCEIFGNTIKIKNTEKYMGATIWGFQSIIGSTNAYNNEVAIYDNIIEIDGYDNSLLPIIACNGENILVENNKVRLLNPLESITSEGPSFFHTYGGKDMEVTGNFVSGTIGKGFVVTPKEGWTLENIQVNNEYENCVGEEIVLNDHPDQNEVNSDF